jgi:ABC-type transport system involved in cytochrome c biogenesis permease subunit
MLEMSTIWMRVAAVLYAAGLLHVLLVALRKDNRLFGFALAAFRIGVILHVVSVVEEAIGTRGVPLNNFYESASACALLLALLFLLIYQRYRMETLGVFVFPLVFVLALAGSLGRPVAPWSSPAVRDAWLLVHVAFVMLGFAALAVMTGAALLYLVQERRLKTKRSGAGLPKLPPLGTLDGLISRAMGLAFVLITLAVVAGSIWGFVEWGTRWIREPKIAISLVTWGFYLVMVYLRRVAGWRGRKAALMALVVVCCSAATWAAHVGLRSIFIR